MGNVNNLFQSKKREVSAVIEDILTQQAEFSSQWDHTRELARSASWLLNKLEEQHQKRSEESIDLSHDPLLLILELSAYYNESSKKARSSVTSHDGFLAELPGVQKCADLISSYTRWYESLPQPLNTKTALLIRDPKELTQLSERFKLNSAVYLAAQFQDSRKFGPYSG